MNDKSTEQQISDWRFAMGYTVASGKYLRPTREMVRVLLHEEVNLRPCLHLLQDFVRFVEDSNGHVCIVCGAYWREGESCTRDCVHGQAVDILISLDAYHADSDFVAALKRNVIEDDDDRQPVVQHGQPQG